MTSKHFILFLLLIWFRTEAFSQNEGKTGKPVRVSGSAGLTNNGISLIPNFSLGDPAALFNLSVAKGRLSFVTDFNFSLEAKPWYILYWVKYKVADGDKFKMSAATHLGLNFRQENLQRTERYWVAELFPQYLVTRNMTIGMYYLYSRGLDPGTVDATHFLTVNANFVHIKMFRDIYLGVNPQLYYLKQDKPDGYYFTSTFTLGKDNFPVVITYLMNHEIKTEIAAGKGFVWNFGVRYSFGQ